MSRVRTPTGKTPKLTYGSKSPFRRESLILKVAEGRDPLVITETSREPGCHLGETIRSTTERDEYVSVRKSVTGRFFGGTCDGGVRDGVRRENKSWDETIKVGESSLFHV